MSPDLILEETSSGFILISNHLLILIGRYEIVNDSFWNNWSFLLEDFLPFRIDRKESLVSSAKIAEGFYP